MIDTTTYVVVSTAAVDPAPEVGGHVIAISPNGTVYITDAIDRTVRVLTVTRGNTAPIAGTPSVGAPSADTGAVSGALNFIDPDGDTLSYSVNQPSTGVVTITSTGVYSFTPTQAARRAAATDGPTSTSFIVTASDGRASAPVAVTAPISPAVGEPVVTVVNNLVLSGWTTGARQLMSPDGSRVLITTYPRLFETTLATVIDTTTGTPIGAVSLPGILVASLLSTNGSRAVITTEPDGGGGPARVAVINPTTGAQVGTTLSLTGGAARAVLSADGTRAVITTQSATGTTRATVINTTTGTKIGTTLALSGGQYVGTPLLSPDGSRAVITTRTFTASSTTTRVAVINMATGTKVGTTVTITGEPLVSPVLTADGSRALITTVPTPTTSPTASPGWR